MNLRGTYIQHGALLGAEVGSLTTATGRYLLRIEALPGIEEFVRGFGVAYTIIPPEADSGRTWVQIPYSREIDGAIRDAVETLVDLRVNRPSFGQFRLLDVEPAG